MTSWIVAKTVGKTTGYVAWIVEREEVVYTLEKSSASGFSLDQALKCVASMMMLMRQKKEKITGRIKIEILPVEM